MEFIMDQILYATITILQNIKTIAWAALLLLLANNIHQF